MELKRYKNNPILEKNIKNPWEAGSVLNPSVLYDDGIYRMVYRATNDIKTKRQGKYISSIGYAESKDGIHFTRFDCPIIGPDKEYEIGLGCEDPRVTKIDDTYFLYYTAVKGIGKDKDVRIALATSRDFIKWSKHGIIGPNIRSKAACLFPEKINGRYIMLYTLRADDPESSIIQVKLNSINDVLKPPKKLIDDYSKNVLIAPEINSYRGPEVGAAPIKVKEGWLLIYCNSNVSNHPEWTIGAALLDLNNPQKVLAKTRKPILKPETIAELKGVVDNVTFPSGAVIVGDNLYVYYGSGDQGICLATCNLNSLLENLVRI